MDGTLLTLYRTACVSGLASKLLARKDCKVLVMVGAGSLAPHLIKAHLAAVLTLERVIIWNRTIKKTRELVEKLRKEQMGNGNFSFESSEYLDETIEMGDIVSCATNAEAALVKGSKLKPGAHLDLVGSFKEKMKECDDEAIRRGRVFANNEAAMVEAGELIGALGRGVTRKEDIGLLADLITGDRVGRRRQENHCFQGCWFCNCGYASCTVGVREFHENS